MKNYLGQTLALAALTTLLLLALGFLPAGLKIRGISLREMDILSDVRPEEQPEPAQDTLQIVMPGKNAFIDTTLVVIDSADMGVLLEDYSAQQLRLRAFFSTIDSITSRSHTVRVAFFGDSFVEGDIILGDLRDTLQTRWGGEGVGFVPITSEVARFRRSLQHNYNNWKTHSIVKRNGGNPPYGINGFVYYPKENAELRYEGTSQFKHTRHWSKLRLFYSNTSDSGMVFQINGGAWQPETLPGADRISVFEFKQPGIRSAAFRFPHADSLPIYGVSLENGPGIYFDNFAVRGNTGGALKFIQPSTARAFDELLGYDLIVLQVGLNAVTSSLNNIQWYRAELERTVKHLQACFPGRPILMISVGDRGGKVGEALGTMISVPAIVNMQRSVARDNGLLFFDLFRCMGGEGTMIGFANAKPALAEKDFTHLTHAGGKVMGHKLATVFLKEYENYQSQKTHQ
ncbi:MAG: hypothetical protein IT270_04445 [Saprospiraceae bacterium]|nr:hypothetical protein [Saprospiraceae bacterium]